MNAYSKAIAISILAIGMLLSGCASGQLTSTPTLTSTSTPIIPMDEWIFEYHPSLAVFYDPNKWVMTEHPVFRVNMIYRLGVDAGVEATDGNGRCRITVGPQGGEYGVQVSITNVFLGSLEFKVYSFTVQDTLNRDYQLSDGMVDPGATSIPLNIGVQTREEDAENCFQDAQEVIQTLHVVTE